MIQFKNENDVIDSYQRIGRPLTNDLVIELRKVAQELHDKQLPLEWVLVDLNCRICGHKQTALAPAIADLDDLECENCGNMTAQEADAKEWWEE